MSPTTYHLRLALLLALLLGALLGVAPAHAATIFVVRNTNDSGSDSLRQSILIANSGDTITFDPALAGQTLALSSAGLVIDKNLTIQGLGADKLTISGSKSFTVIDIENSAFVTLSGLTIADGVGLGGGIFNHGILTLNNSVVRNNEGDIGAGIVNDLVLTVNNSTISDNVATSNGGGITTGQGSTVTINNSTITRNRAQSAAGGLDNQGTMTVNSSTVSSNSTDELGGGVDNSGTLTVNDSTITGNVTNNGGNFRSGGGISNASADGAVATLRNTIVAGNFDTSNTAPDVFGGFTSGGNNLIGIGDGSAGFANVDQVGTKAAPIDAKLGPLASNGGLTQTHLPQTGSPAIDKGAATCPAVDQRGVSRPQGVACDVGAVEVETVVTPPPAPAISVAPGGVCFTGSTPKATINLLVDPADAALTASSSNQALLPDANLKAAGSGPERTLTLTAAGTNGQAQITLTASNANGRGTVTVNVLVGTANADTIVGTPGNDVIFGLGAGDTLNGGNGNDLLCGGSGNNTLSGGDGDDTLVAESGSDTLSGGAGNDLLIAGKGTNVLNGDAGNDTLVGGDGKDTLNGGDGDDALTGAKGADRFSGGNGTDVATDFNAAQKDTQDGTIP